MAAVLRYVNNKGQVIECFIGIEHVPSTTALSLKFAIDKLFSRYSLSISRLCGQGYDGASNMQGKFKGLKLALVVVAKKHTQIELFFSSIAIVVNVVGASAKRSDIFQDKQGIIIAEALQNGEISSGHGLNQHTSLKHCGDTRWGSHYELNDRFNEVNIELLICMVCLSPIDLFSYFNKKRLIQLAKDYQDDFSIAELMALDIQLEAYIIDMRSSEEFRELKGISDLAQKMHSTSSKHLLLMVRFNWNVFC
ncbi:hypothetical protein UlMin_042082 [Ulmus minor]